MPPHVVIIGGGLAGLAAAAGLAGRSGLTVTLCESRPRWGGRASSFLDQTTGESVDNCQHVALGCCTNFRHFCDLVGIGEFFQRESELAFIDGAGKISRMAAAPLPAPLHLAPAFAGFGFLSWRDKIRLAWGLRALARLRTPAPTGQSFLDWLRQHHQTPATIERFWHVVLVSALSETLDRIDIGHARKVFVDGFLAHRAGWEVWVPTAPLDDLYGTRLADWLTARQVTLRLQAGARRVVFNTDPASTQAESSRAVGIELRSGEVLSADEVILAVPQNLVLPLLPAEWQSHPALSGIQRLETAPISSVHLWFDRPITHLRHATFVDRLSQWLFNRSAIHTRTLESAPATTTTAANPPETHYYQVVISASREVLARDPAETIAAVVNELAGVWPVVREAKLCHSRLVTEHKAVVSMLPGVDELRPRQQSPIPNLQLAGDWTQTGWPGTMEGAVRSGYLAAENVLRRCGLPASLIQPDLPVARLSKWLLGL
ncbi:MAG: FAD-dependent oxidoreductase [Planctomycetes bacterium]|nr:FAD-dependent oxidoreductase [Planctomycetota bacterium]